MTYLTHRIDNRIEINLQRIYKKFYHKNFFEDKPVTFEIIPIELFLLILNTLITLVHPLISYTECKIQF